MDSYQFALQCIVSQTILDCESFTEQAIKTVLVDELGQQNFLDALNDFKSFEGLNHKFIVNFTGAWLKYALKGVIDKDKIKDSIKASKLKRDILAGEFDKKELGGGSPPSSYLMNCMQKSTGVQLISILILQMIILVGLSIC